MLKITLITRSRVKISTSIMNEVRKEMTELVKGDIDITYDV